MGDVQEMQVQMQVQVKVQVQMQSIYMDEIHLLFCHCNCCQFGKSSIKAEMKLPLGPLFCYTQI